MDGPAPARAARPRHDRPARWRAAAAAAVYGLSVCLASVAATAQGIPLVRDAETENLLKDYSRPIFRAAGLGSHIPFGPRSGQWPAFPVTYGALIYHGPRGSATIWPRRE